MAWKWDEANGHYRTEKGRYIPASEIRKAVDATLDSLKSESDALAARLAAGTLELDDWHVEMRRLVKQTHAMSMMAAVGGRKRMTASLYGQLGARVKAQYQFLSNFRQEIANDLAGSPEAIAARARLYIHGGSQTYEAARRPVAEKAGYRFERRHIHSGRPCTDCIGYAAQGWVPIGTLPPPGAECACISSCRCSFAYRKAEGEPAPRPKAPQPKPPKPSRQPPRPKAPPEPREPPTPKFGPSKARVEFGGDADAARRTLAGWLGRPVADADFASLVGAPDDATVTVEGTEREVRIALGGPNYSAGRSIFRDKAGVYVHNSYLEVDPEGQGKGLGRRIFGRQVEQAARLGVSRIQTEGSRGGGMFGYKVWPRFGYDGPIPGITRQQLPETLRGAERLSDLMRTPEGRAWWDDNGRSVDLEFDLADGSLSRRAWEGYLRAKVAAEKAKASP